MNYLLRIFFFIFIGFLLGPYPPNVIASECEDYIEPILFQEPNQPSSREITFDLQSINQLECSEAQGTQMLVSAFQLEEEFFNNATDLVASTVFGYQPSVRINERQLQALKLQWENALIEQQIQSDQTGILIDQLYSMAIFPEGEDISYDKLIGLALFDYTRMVRDVYGEPAHTLVPALIDDPFCNGDIIGDRTLWRYFQSLVLSKNGNIEDYARATLMLKNFAVQTACLGNQQLYQLDYAMSVAWYRLQERLFPYGLSFLNTQLAAIILEPRLILYDATKHFGNESPSYVWLTNQTALREALVQHPIWPIEQRLWVYDRQSGNLVGLDTTCSDGGIGSNCINLSVLVDSLINPIHMGMGECSILQMTDSGIHDVLGTPGYLCSPGICGTPIGGNIPNTTLGESFIETWDSTSGQFTLPNPASIDTTPFGVSIEQAREFVCNAGKLDGSNGSNRGNPCETGIPEVSNPALACVITEAEQRSPNSEVNFCITSRNTCEEAFSEIQQEMTVTELRGVPTCQLINEQPNGEQEAQTEAAINAKAQGAASFLQADSKAKDALQDAVESATGERPTDTQVQEALEKVYNAASVDSLKDKDGNTFAGTTDSDGNISIAEDVWAGSTDEANTDTILHEAVHSLINIMHGDGNLDGYPDVGSDAKENLDSELLKRWNENYKKHCSPDNDECNNTCNGMSQQVNDALACLANAASSSEFTGSGPGNPNNPFVIDPLPDDVSADSGLLNCLMPQNDPFTIATSVCSTVLCANPNAGYDSVTQSCCETSGVIYDHAYPGFNEELCQTVLCADNSLLEGNPIASGVSMCGCGGAFSGLSIENPPAPIGVIPFEQPFFDPNSVDNNIPLEPEIQPDELP